MRWALLRTQTIGRLRRLIAKLRCETYIIVHMSYDDCISSWLYKFKLHSLMLKAWDPLAGGGTPTATQKRRSMLKRSLRRCGSPLAWQFVRLIHLGVPQSRVPKH